MSEIRRRVKELIRQYGTAEPSTLSEKMGVSVITQELPESINGFTVKMYGQPFVVLNQNLDDDRSRLTLAHELGHIVLHEGMNSLNLSLNTRFCVSRYEREADSFAVMLLTEAIGSAFEGMESVTTETIARMIRIPQEIGDRAFL